MPPSKRAASSKSQSQLADASGSAASAVQQATAVLEEQLAAGVTGARKVVAGLAQSGQIDESAFDEVVERLRSSAHDVIGVAAGRVQDLKTDEVQDLAVRFAADAHTMLDAVIDLVAAAPVVLNRLSGAIDQRIEPKARPTKKTTRTAK